MWDHLELHHIQFLVHSLSFNGFLVPICWLPCYVGIQGNELADIFTKSVLSLSITLFLLFFHDFHLLIYFFVKQVAAYVGSRE